jgi:hypothetical protein
VRRFSVSRRAKGVLAGLAFLFSVGAVSTKLLVGRTNEFCFCLPPVSRPAFTMPEETTAAAEIHGGALPGRVVAAGAPIAVTAINAPALAPGSSAAPNGVRGRELAHLGVLWGTSQRIAHSSSSSRGHFGGGATGTGGMLMGGHSANTQKNTAKAAAPKAARAAAAPARPSTPGVIVPAAPAAPILPPTDTSGSTFGSNTAPVPGFGNGSTGPVASTPQGTLGGTIGGTVSGGRGGSLSVTPEPTMWLLMITGVVALIVARRREKEVNG